ncbi:hypothetical protein ACHAXS_009446 [Conticribra weissflogii]
MTILRSAIPILVAFASASASPFELPELPYRYDALQPIIGEKTLITHHTKHHAKYVNTANTILSGDDATSTLTLEQIIQSKEIRENNPTLFNNAAQIWNHSFYWKCMTPPNEGGGGKPDEKGLLSNLILRDFGSFDNFRADIESAALTAFGSGWAWLGYDKEMGKLVVSKTIGAGNPLTEGITPILTIDVWEHAYYLDYQEKRNAYVAAFFDSLVNWDFVEENLKLAIKTNNADEL